jgi:hypothetical protein
MLTGYTTASVPFEAFRRLIIAPLLCAGGVLVAVVGLVVIMFGRQRYAGSVGSALSRSLNAATGGDERATFSAWSAFLVEEGAATARLRIWLVDAVNLEPGHCARALASHRERGLLPYASENCGRAQTRVRKGVS